jgi:hypothetical protein
MQLSVCYRCMSFLSPLSKLSKTVIYSFRVCCLRIRHVLINRSLVIHHLKCLGVEDVIFTYGAAASEAVAAVQQCAYGTLIPQLAPRLFAPVRELHHQFADAHN